MAIKGIFASDSGAQGDRVGDFSRVVSKVVPTGTARLLALSSGMRRKKAKDTIVNWMEQNWNSGRIKIIADAVDCCGQVTFEDTSMVIAGQVYMVECTGEYFYVLGVNCDMVSVKRGHGNTPVVDIPAGSFVQRVGTGFEEGSDAPTGYQEIGFPRFNFTQIFRNSWGATRTAGAVDYHSGSKYAESKSQAMMQHAEDIEWAALWGIQEIAYQNGNPLRFADGFNNQIITNRFHQPSTGLSLSMLDYFFMKIFERNIKGKPNERIAFVGNAVIAVINELVRQSTQYNISSNESEFGIRVWKYITPFGDISFMTHPLMNQNPAFQGDMYVYHPGGLEFRWLRETTVDEYNKNGSRSGKDSDNGVMTSELTFVLKNEIVHGIFSGICKPDYRKPCEECKPEPCCNAAPNCGC